MDDAQWFYIRGKENDLDSLNLGPLYSDILDDIKTATAADAVGELNTII
jgi:hypothetical protein